MRSIAIPGTTAIIVIPIRDDRECDDRKSQNCAAADDRHALILVGIDQIACVYPSTIWPNNYVAPRPRAQATRHRDLSSWPEPRDQRIILVRAGVNIDVLRRVCSLCRRAQSQ